VSDVIYHNRLSWSGKTTEVIIKMLHNEGSICLSSSNGRFPSDWINKRVFVSSWNVKYPEELVKKDPYYLGEEYKQKVKELFFQELEQAKYLIIDDELNLSLSEKRKIIDICNAKNIKIVVYYTDFKFYPIQSKAWRKSLELFNVNDEDKYKIKQPYTREWIMALIGVDIDKLESTPEDELWENYEPRYEPLESFSTQ